LKRLAGMAEAKIIRAGDDARCQVRFALSQPPVISAHLGRTRSARSDLGGLEELGPYLAAPNCHQQEAKPTRRIGCRGGRGCCGWIRSVSEAAQWPTSGGSTALS
jgi:hypothetical protein